MGAVATNTDGADEEATVVSQARASRVQSTTFPNGLTLLSKEDHTAPIATFWVWYRVGGRNEGPGITGISHWVEHMLFKGTPTLGKGEIFRTVTKNGGTLNGFTWIDFTAYFETLPADRLDLALRIESDRMVNSSFDPDEVASERTVILSERSGNENSPTYLLAEEVISTAFKVHPYGSLVIGWRCDLETMTREDLYSHYRRFYHPGNAVVVCVGDFDTTWLTARVGELFGAIPAGEASPVVRSVEPVQEGERRVTLRRPAPTRYLQIAYQAPAASSPDAFPAIVLDAVLSGAKGMGMGGRAPMGRSSRLYRNLVHRGLCSSAGSSFYLTKDPYLFGVSATLRPGTELAAVEQEVFTELESIRSTGVSEEEVERAKKQVRAQFTYGSEGVTSQAYWLGNLAMVAEHTMYDSILDRIAAVTVADVQAVARTYLTENRRTVGRLEPTVTGGGPAMVEGVVAMADSASDGPRCWTGVTFPPPPSNLASGEGAAHSLGGLPAAEPSGAGSVTTTRVAIERRELPNGIVVLGHENHEVPVVVLRAMLKAGAVLDDPTRVGQARFTGAMLQRGTGKWSFEALNELTDSHGMGIGVDAGRHTTDVLVRCLEEDLGLGIEILAEVLRRPTFPENELETVRGEILTALKESDSSTRAVAERTFRELAYPTDHPYARRVTGTDETVRAMTREDLVAFHERNYRADALVVAVTGAVDLDRVVDLLTGAFGDWTQSARPPSVEVADVPSLAGVSRRDVELAGKTQSDVVLGLPGIRRNDPDFYALDMANMILGRLGLMGRLGENVRDRQGLAYYATSDVEAGLGPGPWAARAGISPANVGRAIDAIRHEVRRLRDELVTEEELADSQSYLTGVLPLALETNDGLARLMLSIELYGLGLDYVDRYPGIIRSLTREQVREAARRHLSADTIAIAVAGPPLPPADA